MSFQEQKWVIGVLFMVPVYAAESVSSACCFPYHILVHVICRGLSLLSMYTIMYSFSIWGPEFFLLIVHYGLFLTCIFWRKLIR